MFIWGSPWCSPLSFSGGGWGWWWGLHIFMSNPTTVLRLSCVVLLLGLWQQKPVQFYRAPCITVELPPYSPCIAYTKVRNSENAMSDSAKLFETPHWMPEFDIFSKISKCSILFACFSTHTIATKLIFIWMMWCKINICVFWSQKKIWY